MLIEKAVERENGEKRKLWKKEGIRDETLV